MATHARLTAAERSVLAFNAAYIAAGLAASLQSGNAEFLLYVAVLCLLLAAVGTLHRGVGFHIALLWGLSIWGMAHMAGGLLPVPGTWPTAGEASVLYNLWIIPGYLKFDQLLHAYGFGLVTVACWQAMQYAFASRNVAVAPSLGLLTLCLAAGMGFGAANEVVEFLATLALPETNVGGYENTGWDLVANAVGAFIAAVAIYGRPNRT